jgi:antitoxin HigA-1
MVRLASASHEETRGNRGRNPACRPVGLAALHEAYRRWRSSGTALPVTPSEKSLSLEAPRGDVPDMPEPNMPKLPPLHPGEVLREEFLKPLGLSAGQVAKALGVERRRIERLAGEKVNLSADTALRLARYFGTSREFWMELKNRRERERAEDRLGKELDRIAPRTAA